MKKLFLLFALLVGAGLTMSLSAQDAGAPGGGISINTNANGGGLGHLQAGSFGGVTNPTNNWAALGQAPFPASGAPYGLRLQRSAQLGVFNFVGGTGTNEEDLVIGWGENTANDLRFRFISDQFSGTFNDVMVIGGNGGVGINTAPVTQYRLDVQGRPGDFAAIQGRSTGFGPGVQGTSVFRAIIGTSTPSSINGYGGEFRSTGGAQTAIGARCFAGAGTSASYAVFGQSTTNTIRDWAGYFVGRTFCTAGVWTASDKRLKTNVEAEESALEKVMQLRPYTYSYKNDEYDFLTLPTTRQHGFMAQELEEVFPEMVTVANHQIDDKENPAEGGEIFEFKGVNYDQMVPVLTAALQEQQELINDLNARIAELEATQGNAATPNRFDQLATETKSVLFQNSPNPFSEATVISYNLPENYQNAAVYVFNMNGQQIAAYENLRGEELVIEGSRLEAGMYFYNLVVDGKEIDMKRMVLTK